MTDPYTPIRDGLTEIGRRVLDDAIEEIRKADDALAIAEDRRRVERRRTDKMECPHCGAMQSKVTDARPGQTSGGFWRRRECGGCGKRFTTEEVVRGKYDAA